VSKTFIRHVFATLTYQRSNPPEVLLGKVSRDFNRWIQEFRRLNGYRRSSAPKTLDLNNCYLPSKKIPHQSIEYFRSIELHKDGYPHLHVLLQWPHAPLSCHNGRYFEAILYRRWKTSWKHGLSDFQPPRKIGVHQLTYIMKYISKNVTCNTVWKKILESPTRDAASVTKPKSSVPSFGSQESSTISASPVYLQTSKSRIKLLTWSRNFDFSPFYKNKNKIALS
jgi:hypothetical protein